MWGGGGGRLGTLWTQVSDATDLSPQVKQPNTLETCAWLLRSEAETTSPPQVITSHKLKNGFAPFPRRLANTFSSISLV